MGGGVIKRSKPRSLIPAVARNSAAPTRKIKSVRRARVSSAASVATSEDLNSTPIHQIESSELPHLVSNIVSEVVGIRRDEVSYGQQDLSHVSE